jgi:hypothetical protein
VPQSSNQFAVQQQPDIASMMMAVGAGISTILVFFIQDRVVEGLATGICLLAFVVIALSFPSAVQNAILRIVSLALAALLLVVGTRAWDARHLTPAAPSAVSPPAPVVTQTAGTTVDVSAQPNPAPAVATATAQPTEPAAPPSVAAFTPPPAAPPYVQSEQETTTQPLARPVEQTVISTPIDDRRTAAIEQPAYRMSETTDSVRYERAPVTAPVATAPVYSRPSFYDRSSATFAAPAQTAPANNSRPLHDRSLVQPDARTAMRERLGVGRQTAMQSSTQQFSSRRGTSNVVPSRRLDHTPVVPNSSSQPMNRMRSASAVAPSTPSGSAWAPRQTFVRQPAPQYFRSAPQASRAGRRR